MEKTLPLPWREGAGGREVWHGSCGFTPPPDPLPQGEGENFLRSQCMRTRQDGNGQGRRAFQFVRPVAARTESQI